MKILFTFSVEQSQGYCKFLPLSCWVIRRIIIDTQVQTNIHKCGYNMTQTLNMNIHKLTGIECKIRVDNTVDTTFQGLCADQNQCDGHVAGDILGGSH
jgi:hypothetical protein